MSILLVQLFQQRDGGLFVVYRSIKGTQQNLDVAHAERIQIGLQQDILVDVELREGKGSILKCEK